MDLEPNRSGLPHAAGRFFYLHVGALLAAPDVKCGGVKSVLFGFERLNQSLRFRQRVARSLAPWIKARIKTWSEVVW